LLFEAEFPPENDAVAPPRALAEWVTDRDGVCLRTTDAAAPLNAIAIAMLGVEVEMLARWLEGVKEGVGRVAAAVNAGFSEALGCSNFFCTASWRCSWALFMRGTMSTAGAAAAAGAAGAAGAAVLLVAAVEEVGATVAVGTGVGAGVGAAHTFPVG
jgi:hypothetical protein